MNEDRYSAQSGNINPTCAKINSVKEEITCSHSQADWGKIMDWR